MSVGEELLVLSLVSSPHPAASRATLVPDCSSGMAFPRPITQTIQSPPRHLPKQLDSCPQGENLAPTNGLGWNFYIHNRC